MKRALFLPILAAAGLLAGAGGASAVRQFAPPVPAAAAPPPITTQFVPVPQVLAPLVMEDGRLSGYVSFDIALEVDIVAAPAVTQRLPMLLHAINMQTYRTPLAAGPDGLLPDIGKMRRLVLTVAPEAFGRRVVRRVAITRAEPA